VKGLVEEGLDVHLFCGTCEREVPGLKKVVETLRPGGIKIPYRFLGTQRAWALHDWRTARAVRSGIGVDLVHAWPLGATRTFIEARRRHIPTLLERPNTHTRFAFEVVEEELQSLGLTLPRDHSHRTDEGRLAIEEEEYRLADRLLCPSEFVASTFVDRGFAASRVSLTQYGYDPQDFCADQQQPKRPLTVGFVGSCEPRKGLHLALKAWSQSVAKDQGQFIICGKFIPHYREKLGLLLDHPSVKVTGFRSDVPAVMRECDVLVLPSVEEGSALVTYEARAAGCVLMVSDAAGARCEHMVDGLVHKARDTEALRMQFDSLARSPELLARLRCASLAGVPDLTWSAAAKRLVEVYREALAERSPEVKEREPAVEEGTVA